MSTKSGNMGTHILNVKLALLPLSQRKYQTMALPRRRMYISLLQTAMETSLVCSGIRKPWYHTGKAPSQMFIEFRTRKRCDVKTISWHPFLTACFNSRLLKPGHIALIQAYEVDSKDGFTNIIVSSEASLQKATESGRGVLLGEMKEIVAAHRKVKKCD